MQEKVEYPQFEPLAKINKEVQVLGLPCIYVDNMHLAVSVHKKYVWEYKDRVKMRACFLRSVHTTPLLHCGAEISITSLQQDTAESPHFKLI